MKVAATPLQSRGLGRADKEINSKQVGGDSQPFLDLIILAAPSLLFLEIDIVGRLFVPELIFAAVLPIAAMNRSRKKGGRRLPAWIFVLGICWLISQVITDLLQNSAFEDFSRGWSKIIMTLVNLAAIFLLTAGSRRRLQLLAWGLVIGLTLQYLINPNPYSLYDPWKFGLATPFTFGLTLLACKQNGAASAVRSFSLMVGAAAVNFFLDFRSMAAASFLAGVYLLFQRARHDSSTARASLGQLLLIGLMLVVATAGFVRAYGYAASSGMLGETARWKFDQQSRGEIGIILGGRGHVLGAIEAIKDSPIIGHGSWATDTGYKRIAELRMRQLGYTPMLGQSNQIPSHSYVLGAWVESGFMGAVFWLLVLTIPVRILASWHQVADPLTPLVILIAITLSWAILFSPFGAEGRLLVPFYLTVLLDRLNTFRPRREDAKNNERLGHRRGTPLSGPPRHLKP